MARPNYGAAKRTKELKKKAKREAKLARKHARRVDQGQGEPAANEPIQESAPPDTSPNEPGPAPRNG
jgi:hypothetical protein